MSLRTRARGRLRAAAALLTLPLALTAGLLTGPAAAQEGVAAREGAAPSARGTALHVPAPNPGALTQVKELVREGRFTDAVGLLRMVRTPQAVWYHAGTPQEVHDEVRAVVRKAAREGTVPVLALYNIPGRDCSNYSGGGASTTAEYQAWVDAVARAIGGRQAIVVLEPDSLALLPSDCGQDDAQGTRTAARYTEVRYAASLLAGLPRTKVYLDAGHPGWHGVRSLVPRLLKGGVDDATGFYLNVSNYHTDAANVRYGKLISACLAYAADGGDAAHCPDQWTPPAEADAWIAEHVRTDPARMKHFVTDSSRNGRGPWTAPAGVYPDPQEWCNPPDRGLGARPTTRTGEPLHDARLWIKIPGESDGLCLRGTPGPEDPARGMVDPKAGAWFPEQALELVRLAQPPIV
ncbi:glycoside hydrolase family 6 protein [Streptomyces sp. TRM76323]|uniref:Glucanase n=1 Tax=Streptomyces tamarix TaxID=3078565 RepID=A0ABU3QRI8_9ACTN|nr:glycoside hydrolase family 6 protein [Streptomyces tamarix]MDT9685385.1 glycoside hydrolase family 6 protein [Streptomyces tamarix]